MAGAVAQRHQEGQEDTLFREDRQGEGRKRQAGNY